MNLPQQNKNQRMIEARFLDIWLRVAVVMLLVAVAGLSTLAKNIQYFPKTNPTHYVTSSTKMKVVHAPVVLERDRQLPVSEVSLPSPRVWSAREDRFEGILIPAIGVTVSMQHRSPPRQSPGRTASFSD
jgi:hypothetical protein